jgi:hypothetical protein
LSLIRTYEITIARNSIIANDAHIGIAARLFTEFPFPRAGMRVIALFTDIIDTNIGGTVSGIFAFYTLPCLVSRGHANGCLFADFRTFILAFGQIFAGFTITIGQVADGAGCIRAFAVLSTAFAFMFLCIAYTDGTIGIRIAFDTAVIFGIADTLRTIRIDDAFHTEMFGCITDATRTICIGFAGDLTTDMIVTNTFGTVFIRFAC